MPREQTGDEFVRIYVIVLSICNILFIVDQLFPWSDSLISSSSSGYFSRFTGLSQRAKKTLWSLKFSIFAWKNSRKIGKNFFLRMTYANVKKLSMYVVILEGLSMTFTANGKNETSVFSSLYSRIKIFVFAVNSNRHVSIFVWFT